MYASLYPSVIRQFNIAPHTQIGMIDIPVKVHDKENRCKLDDRWTRAGAFTEDMISQVWTEIGSRWFHLADYQVLYHEIEEFFMTKMNAYNGLRFYNREGLFEPMVFENPKMLYEPMIFDVNNDPCAIRDVYIQPDLKAWEVWRENAAKYPNQLF